MNKRPFTDKELRDMAWVWAHENFNPFGTPKIHSEALSDSLFKLLSEARGGKYVRPNEPTSKGRS